MDRFKLDLCSSDEVFNLKLDATKRDLQEAINLLKQAEHRHKNQHTDAEQNIFSDDLLKIILDLQEAEIGVGYHYKK